MEKILMKYFRLLSCALSVDIAKAHLSPYIKAYLLIEQTIHMNCPLYR